MTGWGDYTKAEEVTMAKEQETRKPDWHLSQEDGHAGNYDDDEIAIPMEPNMFGRLVAQGIVAIFFVAFAIVIIAGAISIAARMLP